MAREAHILSVDMPSESGDKVYELGVTQGAPQWCSCPDWAYRHPTGGCKHMRALAATLRCDLEWSQKVLQEFLSVEA